MDSDQHSLLVKSLQSIQMLPQLLVPAFNLQAYYHTIQYGGFLFYCCFGIFMQSNFIQVNFEVLFPVLFSVCI